MSDDEHIYRVYKLTFPDGMIYVGMTKQSIKTRVYSGYRHNQNMCNAIAKYGMSNIQMDTLADNLTVQEADKLEIYYIQKYNSTNPDVGYNISRGGIQAWLGLHHSEASRKKMSLSGKGKHSGKNNANFGKVRTKAERERDRIRHTPYMHPIVQFDKFGNFIANHESVSAGARSVGTSTRNIRMCLTGKSKTACGYVWKYKKEGD